MIFTIAVHGTPYGSHSHQHALAFCQASHEAGHRIERVFFYHEGVYGALDRQVVPQDEADLTEQWQQFAQQHGSELCVCIANALKRGVLDEAAAERYEHDSATVAAGFSIVGLGQLVDAMMTADRYVEFPA